MKRRRFLQSTVGAGVLSFTAAAAADKEPKMPMGPVVDLKKHCKDPVVIAGVELLESFGKYFVSVTSKDGVVGVATTTERLAYLHPILARLIVPYFLNKDARDLEALLDGVYVVNSNYKLAGLAFWNCVGALEFALFDLLGKTANKSVGDLLGGVRHKEIPVYMSSLRRDTTPEQEVEWVKKRVEETNARAIKLKIGGRMSKNADAAPGRTDKLVALARKTFGDKFTIYVDANGSYDAEHGITVGKMLQDHGVGFYEEPCPFEEYDETKKVADALTMPVAGGEQDTSWPRFEWMIRNRGVDIVQPDLNYNGGVIRTLRVARLAEAFNLPITPHSPKADANEAYVLHLASVVKNIGAFMEYSAAPRKPDTWYSPILEVKNGAIRVPDGPGLGIAIEPDVLKRATKF